MIAHHKAHHCDGRHHAGHRTRSIRDDAECVKPHDSGDIEAELLSKINPKIRDLNFTTLV